MNRVLITKDLSKHRVIYIELNRNFRLNLDQVGHLYYYPGGFETYEILYPNKQYGSVLFSLNRRYNYWLIIHREDNISRLRFVLGKEENVGVIYDLINNMIVENYKANINQKWISENIYRPSIREQEFIIKMIDSICFIEYE